MTEARQTVCDLLREPATASSAARLTPAILEAARAGRVHLLLAHHRRLPMLADDLRAAAALEAARQAELRTLLRAIAGAGVRAILIKGGAIAYTHYPKPELRPRLDVDLMVPPDRREDVARALIHAGYERLSEVDGELVTSQFHFERRDRAGVLHALDVHWRISNVMVFADALTCDELARDAVALPALGADAWGPSPAHALLLALVHRVAHHGDSEELLWLYDIHLLARRLSASERAAFTDLAGERRMRAVSLKGLALADAAFGGMDESWMAALRASGDPEPGAQFLGGGLRQVDILRADLAAMPRWHGRVELLRQHLFPSPTFMYERYRTQQRVALPFLYVHRIVSGLPKWFRR